MATRTSHWQKLILHTIILKLLLHFELLIHLFDTFNKKIIISTASLCLIERQWNMWIPGFGNDELRPYKRAAVTEAHKQRMALIRKTIKKY